MYRAPEWLKVWPTGVAHSPVMISSCSVSRSNRSPKDPPKSSPYARCSASFQPVPMPSSTRPPEMSSICATATAVIDGCRKVAEVTSVPSLMSGTCAAIAPRFRKESDGPGSPGPSPITSR